MIDQSKERLITIKACCVLFPVPIHYETAREYYRDGMKLDGGKVIKLETVRWGKRRMTSAEAVERFMRSTVQAIKEKK